MQYVEAMEQLARANAGRSAAEQAGAHLQLPAAPAGAAGHWPARPLRTLAHRAHALEEHARDTLGDHFSDDEIAAVVDELEERVDNAITQVIEN